MVKSLKPPASQDLEISKPIICGFLGKLDRRMEKTVRECGKKKELRKPLSSTVEAIGKYPFRTVAGIHIFSRLLKLTVGSGKRFDRFGSRVRKVPDDSLTDNCGQVDPRKEAMGVLF